VIAISIIGFLVLAGFCIYCVWNNARLERDRSRAWDKRENAWAQERSQLLDRIMYLSDRPWDPPTQTEDEPLPDPVEEPYDPTLIPLETLESIVYPAGVV
jgi:hypothetical protein